MPEHDRADPAMLRLENGDLRGELAAVQAELQTLRLAVETRQLIGQATGLVAAQLNLGTEQAWHVLRRVSSLTNSKMRDIAVVVVAAHDGTLDHSEAGPLGQPTDLAMSHAIARQMAEALPVALRQELRHSSLDESHRTSATRHTGATNPDRAHRVTSRVTSAPQGQPAAGDPQSPARAVAAADTAADADGLTGPVDV